MGNRKNDDNTNKNENKHIPKYIKSKPWYYDTSSSEDYLEHHRQSHNKKNTLDIDHNDEAKIGLGIKDSFIANNKKLHRNNNGGLRCSNCGGTDHLKNDCLERPSKIRNSGNSRGLADNKVINENELDYDARKDRWFGYTGKEYDETLKNWNQNKQVNKYGVSSKDDIELWDTDEEIELKKLHLFKDTMGILKKDDGHNTELVTTAVRLREDKAAYLNDINSNETRYDPKSRVYKSEDLGSVDEKSNMFRRYLTGEGLQFSELNDFARREAKQMGIRDEVEDKEKLNHILIANPTKYEQLMKKQKENQSATEGDASKKKVVDISKLQAHKIEGKKQNEKSKKELTDLYK